MRRYLLCVPLAVATLVLAGQGAIATATDRAGSPPAGPAVVVVGLGEPLLAGEAEAYLESALKAGSQRVVDERGIPAADAALGDRNGPLSHDLLEALKPYAETLVLVRAEYLGGRSLRFDQRSEEANQARLTVTLIDLTADTPPESLVNERVEYTPLTVADVLQRVLRPRLPELLKILRHQPER